MSFQQHKSSPISSILLRNLSNWALSILRLFACQITAPIFVLISKIKQIDSLFSVPLLDRSKLQQTKYKEQEREGERVHAFELNILFFLLGWVVMATTSDMSITIEFIRSNLLIFSKAEEQKKCPLLKNMCFFPVFFITKYNFSTKIRISNIQ